MMHLLLHENETADNGAYSCIIDCIKRFLLDANNTELEFFESVFFVRVKISALFSMVDSALFQQQTFLT